eukprot:TRINITY_DN107878_c0_g1_i1.p1 TRINITY_DN107878_c0_g1~~TRINITY_DN107878_c0_g1_i1.p1  ORF type:complete len:916 (+),score=185.58 TRINITY_DN107878_c0_g1_i1:52-2748(+)
MEVGRTLTNVTRLSPNSRHITSGQEAVFKYDLEQQAVKHTCGHPRLCTILVCPVLLTISALAVTLNFLWVFQYQDGLQQTMQVENDIFGKFNASTEVMLTQLAERLQCQSASAALSQIGLFTSWPGLAVNINADSVELSTTFSAVELERIFNLLWTEITQRFTDIDYIYFGDKWGTFIGFERLPKKFVEDHNAPSEFGGEFRAPDHIGATAQVCPKCPPASALKAGEKTYYFVDKTGNFFSGYATKPYDPRGRPWWRQAVAARGKLVWTDIYNHSSGHTLGMSASKAVFVNNEVQAVFVGDFTLSYLSQFVDEVTNDKEEEGFVVDAHGLMVASSEGLAEVAEPLKDHNLKRLHWNDTGDPMISAPLEDLLRRFDSLEKVVGKGTFRIGRSRENSYLYTYSTKLSSSFQGEKNWIVVIVSPVKSYMAEAWEQQAWAEKQAERSRSDLRSQLLRQKVQTLVMSSLFALIGVVFMAMVGVVVSRPLKQISLDMLNLAKLEFIDPASKDATRQRVHRSSSAMSFNSFTNSRRLTRWMSKALCRTSTCSDDDEGESEDSTSSSGGSSDDGSAQTDPKQPIGPCFDGASPIEVVNMREAFAYMVGGLKSFARYMDPEIMKILVKSKRQAQLGMAKAEVTVFFSDIANFTTIAESLDPWVFMQLLTEYLDEMSKIIMKGRGVVGEFIGDAIMAWWNVPIDLGRKHTELALRAALEQQRKLVELRRAWYAQGLPEVTARMGLVRGTVLAGNIGSSQRMKYGLVGDCVNLASRLEGLCKMYGVSIIIEEVSKQAYGVQDKFRIRLLDLVTVKGRKQPTELFELVCLQDEQADGRTEEETEYFISGFEEIHRLYRARSFVACQHALQRYQVTFPHDKPCKMLLERVDFLIKHPPDEQWVPVHVLTEK